MRTSRVLFGSCLAGLVVGFVAACQPSTKSQRADWALSPQDKVHRDQLSAMSQEDADVIARSPKLEPTRPATIRDRRTGQGRIDQPRR